MNKSKKNITNNKVCSEINYTEEKEKGNSYNIILLYIYKSLKICINISGIYILWILLHYISSQLYVELCVPRTFTGLIFSPFLIMTPHCQGLKWIIYNGGNSINNMWIIIGTYLSSFIIKPFSI